MGRPILLNSGGRRFSAPAPGIFSRLGLLLAALSLALAGCAPGVGDPLGSPSAAVTASAEPTSVPTPRPTATSTPSPLRALLIAPPDADPFLVADVEETVAGLAAASGLVLESLPGLEAGDVTPETRMVVAFPNSADLAGIARSSPETGFIAVGIPGLEAAPNLSIVGPQGFRPDQQGFAAGYLAAMQTEDWRVGVVSTGETADGQAARQGFLNGAVYFCGLCRPAFPPFVLYPTFVEVPENADESAWQAAAQGLLGEGVQTVYVPPTVDDPAFRRILAEAGFQLITGLSGEAEGLPGHMAAVAPDPAAGVEAAWAGMLAGDPGHALPMPIALRGVNAELLSSGRISLLEGLISDMMAGVTDTGVDPLTAQPR